MANTISTLSVKLTANTMAFASGMAGAAAPLQTLGGKVASVGTGVAGLAAALGGGALLAGAGGLGMYAIKLAADAEQARVSFTTMLGSVDKAKALMADINAFAAATPFATPELIDASKKLLAFGVAQDQIIPTMRTLGDVASGLNIPIGELSELYGKAKVQGRLFAEDINQLTGRGIPVIGEFAKQFGVSEGEVRKLVETGKIGFPQMQQAMVSLTGEGGKFSGLMKAQSQTIAGLYSTLEDTVVMSLTRVGETLTDKLNLGAAIGGVTTAIDALATAGLPLLEAFIGDMTAGGNIGQQAGSLVLGGAEMIATGLAYAIDYSNLLVAGFKVLQAGAAFAIGGVLVSIDYLGQGLVALLNKLPGVSLEWDNTLGQMGQSVLDEASKLGGEAATAFDNFGNANSAAKVGQFFDTVRSNAAKAAEATAGVGDASTQTALKIEQATVVQSEKVKTMLEKLRTQVAEFGQTDAQKLVGDVKAAGGSDADVAEAGKLQGQLDAMEKAKKLQADAASVFESTRSPMEKYETQIGRLSEMLNSGAIDWSTYSRAVQQARGSLEDSANTTTAPDMIAANSAEAQRLAYDGNRGSQKMTVDDIAKKAYAESQGQTKVLEEIAKNTRSATADVTEVEL